MFFAVFLVSYFATRGRGRLWVCLVSSYVFYGWWDWRFLGLIALSTVIDFYLGQRLADSSDATHRKRLVLASVAVNLGILGLFKYLNFFIDSLHAGLLLAGVDVGLSSLEIILPVGISFYTFQTMSYSIDLYRGHLEVERDPLRFAVFVAFFPQLVAGPIVRASTMLPQLRQDAPLSFDRVVAGGRLAVWGLFKKVVVADNLAPVVDAHFANPEAYSSLGIYIAVVFYSFQIYCDFSGYSDIAIGLARMIGFEFPLNFNKPYFSRDFAEFWRRWHISLSSWLRDYLYIPLGGNRVGAFMTYRNLLITMLLGGLWHGAAWTFVVWGALHGSYLVLQRLFPTGLANALRRLLGAFGFAALQIVVTFALTCLAWVFFRAQSFEGAWEVLDKLVNLDGLGISGVRSKFPIVKGFIVIGLVLACDLASTRARIVALYERSRVFQALGVALCLWAIALLGSFSGTQFIYFQF